MAKPLFIWLGAGRARRRGVGPSGRAIDAAAAAGLPVPPGAILLDEFYRFALHNGLAEPSGDHVFVPDVELLFNTLIYSVRVPPLSAPATLRPLFSEPGERDHPCVQEPALRLLVDPSDPAALSRGLSRLWSAAFPAGETLRRDLVLCRQVAARVTGHGYIAEGEVVDCITLAGAPDGAAYELPHLGRWSGPDPTLPPHLQRLQRLLRGLRRTLGPGNWGVEWADDDEICWLVGVSPD
jgi:hypothetical protein